MGWVTDDLIVGFWILAFLTDDLIVGFWILAFLTDGFIVGFLDFGFFNGWGNCGLCWGVVRLMGWEWMG